MFRPMQSFLMIGLCSLWLVSSVQIAKSGGKTEWDIACDELDAQAHDKPAAKLKNLIKKCNRDPDEAYCVRSAMVLRDTEIKEFLTCGGAVFRQETEMACAMTAMNAQMGPASGFEANEIASNRDLCEKVKDKDVCEGTNLVIRSSKTDVPELNCQ
ncbi:hypothetical protein [Mesorhizobium sp. L103C105A0]|uniref:hypothetical protein n=1 Tax=Mesorhizobium sp. L103C105A0 TaxID=1287074 RepID=UPI0003CFC5D8|nr:hypothetical protein [Mesorhizobium sp. L103C105A0]ESZ78652.1 hypothetical protein X726_03580 [Mesorhizobium sp. L103C105A0]